MATNASDWAITASTSVADLEESSAAETGLSIDLGNMRLI
ncbi:hypothetical protein SynPROS91_01932 [Synechococcus sp. PROS-9-1]|nr:hypothetical protein SynPROS91_01932 [Synechococcus sp. PROS-9-1]